jgi:uncharacterized protein YjdB
MENLMSHRVKDAATRTAAGIVARVHSLTRHVIPAIVIAGLTSCSSEPPVMPVSVATVDVTPDREVIFAGITLQLSATTRDANGNLLTGRAVSWSTSDAHAATVSATGVVTYIGPGIVAITATSEGKTGSAEIVAVSIPVASVEVTPIAATLRTGTTHQLTARPLSNTGQPLPGRVVTWSSSDESRVKVSATGLITAVGVGAVTVTARSEGRSASAEVTVVPAT